MDKQDLFKLDEILYKQIQEQRKQKEAENKAFFDGVEKGAEMMMKKVRDFLNEEEAQKKQSSIKNTITYIKKEL